MKKYPFKSVAKSVAFGLIISSLAIVTKAEEPQFEPSALLIPPGSFNLNPFTGYVSLQSDHTNLIVKVDIDDNSHNYMAKIYKPPIPVEEFSIWILAKNDKFLPLISRGSGLGQTPVEGESGASSTTMTTIYFRYKLDPTVKPTAVVLEVEDKFQVFKIRDKF